MKTSNHFLLGLLFLVALSILGYFTFFHSDFRFFGLLGDAQRLTVHFPQGGGLREGDTALVAGVRWGKVTSITYDPTVTDPRRRITVLISLDEPVILHADHEIVIENATLLGGKNLTIDPGSADEAEIGPDTILYGEVQLNVIEAAGELLANNESALTETISMIQNLMRGIEDGKGAAGRIFSDEEFAGEIERTVKGAADTADNLRTITARLVEGQGTVGQLLANDEIYIDLRSISASLATVLDEVEGAVEDLLAGRGLIGAALVDEGLSQNVKEAVRNLKEILARTNAGEGTLGKILVEEDIALSMDTVLKRLAAGEGTLGRLFAEDDIYFDLRETASDLRDVVATIRDGRGSLGKLIMEEDMYAELLKAVGLLTRSLEEYREAAPISTMTSVIFGAF